MGGNRGEGRAFQQLHLALVERSEGRAFHRLHLTLVERIEHDRDAAPGKFLGSSQAEAGMDPDGPLIVHETQKGFLQRFHAARFDLDGGPADHFLQPGAVVVMTAQPAFIASSSTTGKFSWMEGKTKIFADRYKSTIPFPG